MDAAHGNASSMSQRLAHCYPVGCKPAIDRWKTASCHFGNGSENSEGTALISFPLGAITVTIEALIFRDGTVPLLICIDEMDRRGLYFDSIKNCLVHTPTNQTIPVTRDGAHSFIL